MRRERSTSDLVRWITPQELGNMAGGFSAQFIRMEIKAGIIPAKLAVSRRGKLGRYRIRLADAEKYVATLKGEESFVAPEPAKPLSGVYFFACSGFIKIGMSYSVVRRLGDFRAMIPVPVVPLGYVPSDQPANLEAELHRLFASQRHNREWFNDHPTLRDYIAAHCLPWPTTTGNANANIGPLPLAT
jgi:hypothetical protein